VRRVPFRPSTPPHTRPSSVLCVHKYNSSTALGPFSFTFITFLSSSSAATKQKIAGGGPERQSYSIPLEIRKLETSADTPRLGHEFDSTHSILERICCKRRILPK
jgi:hypothetical protein